MIKLLLVRILDFGVDPDSFRGIYPRVVGKFLFKKYINKKFRATIICFSINYLVGCRIFAIFILVFFYFKKKINNKNRIELQRMSGIKQLRNVVKLKPG